MNIIPIFPTLIYSGTVPVQDGTVERIMELKSNNESVKRSNIGGWQSKRFDDDPLIDYFLNNIHQQKALPDFELLSSWVNVNDKGDYNMPHLHPESDYSFIWYINAPKDSGCVVFENPHVFVDAKFLRINYNVGVKCNSTHTYQFPPVESAFYFFPAKLTHWVEENKSDEPRISIAGNINFKDDGAPWD